MDLPIDGPHQTAPPEACSPIATANTLPPTAAQCRRRHLPLVRSRFLTTVLVRQHSARKQPPPLRHHQNREPPPPALDIPPPTATANHDNKIIPPTLSSTWISSPLPRERRLPQWRTHTSTTMTTSTLLPAPEQPPHPFRRRADGTEKAWYRPDGGAGQYTDRRLAMRVSLPTSPWSKTWPPAPLPASQNTAPVSSDRHTSAEPMRRRALSARPGILLTADSVPN